MVKMGVQNGRKYGLLNDIHIFSKIWVQRHYIHFSYGSCTVTFLKTPPNVSNLEIHIKVKLSLCLTN
jgi:hypothetical protein